LQLIPANRPGLAIARWRVSSHSDDFDLEIFEDSEALVEPGLLEAIVLSVVLLRSGRALEMDVLGISERASFTSYATVLPNPSSSLEAHRNQPTL